MKPSNREKGTPDKSPTKQSTPEDTDCRRGGPEEETLASVALFFVENCTAHGLPRLAAEKSLWRKIVWALIFIGAMGYFCFSLQKIIITYLKYEVNVNTILHTR